MSAAAAAPVTEDELVAQFSKIGLDDSKIKEILKNKKVSKSLNDLTQLLPDGAAGELGSTKLNLLHNLATLIKGEDLAKIGKVNFIVSGIVTGDLLTNLQIGEALKYVKSAGDSATVEELNTASGVGIVVTEEDVDAAVVKYFDENKEEILDKRYKIVPSLLGSVKNLPGLKFAEPKLFKPIIDKRVLELLGPKDERDLVKKKEKKAKEPSAKESASKASASNAEQTKERSIFSEGFLGDLHKAGENPQMYPELMKEHLKTTGGRVQTRFPPEPNGFLHIGHSKAIMVNFGYAKFNNGICYLRYDDTNPEAEEQVYFDSILNMVEWLGFEPFKITYSSDYFDRLYELAENMIKIDRAYVDHSTAEEVKKQRGIKEDGTPGGERSESPWRNRPVEESLQEFRNMRDGKYEVGKATLRMKMDIESPNPQMWDLVAYRVLNAHHARTGDKWKIYPTYDFTHCLVDSFENISHSLCTTEFYLSRESYEWLCDTLHVYRPAQREYGRLNITGTIMSKRKIAKLVNEKYVRGWDDPRLYTLESLKRRGIPPGAILSFINTLGVTTSTTNIQSTRLDSSVRNYLDVTTPRLMMITDPLKVEITNLPLDYEELISIPYKPGSPEFGDRDIPFTKTIYIDESDYRDEISKDYFRLAPGQSVGLMKVPFTISVESVDRDANGKPVLIHAHYNNDEAKKTKPKTFIQWIPESKKYNSPVNVKEVRIHNQLFKSENPSSNPEGYLADINPESEHVIHNAMVEPAFFEIQTKSPMNMPFVNNSDFSIFEKGTFKSDPQTVRFQALRVGYFCVDKDSKDDALVLNRIVTLKEDSAKSS